MSAAKYHAAPPHPELLIVLRREWPPMLRGHQCDRDGLLPACLDESEKTRGQWPYRPASMRAMKYYQIKKNDYKLDVKIEQQVYLTHLVAFFFTMTHTAS